MSAMHPKGRRRGHKKEWGLQVWEPSREETKWEEGEDTQAVWSAEARAEDCFRKGCQLVSGISCLLMRASSNSLEGETSVPI